LKTIIDPSQNFIPTDKISAIHNPNTRRHFFLFSQHKTKKQTATKNTKEKEKSFFFYIFIILIFNKKRDEDSIGAKSQGRGGL
jgi:hypothetical protein